jgi:hypothetical protein
VRIEELPELMLTIMITTTVKLVLPLLLLILPLLLLLLDALV